MIRLANCSLALLMLMASTPSSACAPDMIDFHPGSSRLGAGDLRLIEHIVSTWRVAPTKRVLLSTGSDGLAGKRIGAIKRALMRRGIRANAIIVRADSGNSRVVQMDVVAAAKPTAPPTCG